MVMVEITANRRLRISADPEEVEDYGDDCDDISALYALLEPFWSNGEWYVYTADLWGHLSEAPLIVQYVDIEDDGTMKGYGHVFWYPDYQVSNCVNEIRRHGYVDFDFAYLTTEDQPDIVYA